MPSSYSNRWGLVLAGGDGSRLKSFTKRIAGYELPKQFCPILSSKPLLEETIDRVSRMIPRDRTLVSLNREHRRFYAPMFQGAVNSLVEEPRNRGTAPAILHALMQICERSPSAIVGLFPSDHYFGNEARFIEYVGSAFDAAGDSDDAVVLLGAEATGPEQAYGWIEPEISLTSAQPRLLSVRSFVEKPDARLANDLWRSGALWNTFVLVARASALMQMFIRAMPRLYSSFSTVRPVLGTMFEAEVLTRLYNELPTSCFSEVVLQRCAANLMVMPMRGVEWCDLGEPARVTKVARQIGVSPQWAVA
ncbi:MAG: sugar phosphate nucleotidyltransferase [Candidatus Binatus sp.]|uniref:sugar phosphate nucleotidyltransferase n=1 Tax=Candidatus Binatus sp. TaxID=2811406 RepID=UPI002721AEAE|nr:sugar phosphate nucleotidyltransferase [Candidatus Binatus sp.]MDO8430996.1 sugar phosphate nucleotidyltransferase [Candidatus Binatus sp.]